MFEFISLYFCLVYFCILTVKIQSIRTFKSCNQSKICSFVTALGLAKIQIKRFLPKSNATKIC